MLNKITCSIGIFVVAVCPALANFEGVLQMKISVDDKAGANQGSGKGNVSVSKAGTRSEMQMQMQDMMMKFVTIVKSDNPDVLYRVNDDAKTFTEMNLSQFRALPGQRPNSEKYTVKKLGEEKLLGYKTQHVLAFRGTTTNELWTSKDVLDYSTFSKLQARRGVRPGDDDSLEKALKDAGVDGMPLKSIMTSEDGTRATMDVVSAEARTLPASTFEIPADYQKSAGGIMDNVGGISGPRADEAKKRMEEAMKNMTPEQRQMFERMMKQRGNSAP